MKKIKNPEKLPAPGKVKKGFRYYAAAVLSAAVMLGTAMPALAAGDPLGVVNNLSTFIFGLIRAAPEPRCFAAFQRLPDPGGWHRHYVCQGDPRPHHRLNVHCPNIRGGSACDRPASKEVI